MKRFKHLLLFHQKSTFFCLYWIQCLFLRFVPGFVYIILILFFCKFTCCSPVFDFIRWYPFCSLACLLTMSIFNVLYTKKEENNKQQYIMHKNLFSCFLFLFTTIHFSCCIICKFLILHTCNKYKCSLPLLLLFLQQQLYREELWRRRRSTNYKDEYALKVKTCERETLTLHHKSYHFSFFLFLFLYVVLFSQVPL